MSIKQDLLSMSVLTLDDNVINTELVDAILDMHEFTNFKSLNDPHQLESILASEGIDLLLLDINMPVMDGFAVLEMINQKFSPQERPNVIMLTAQGDLDSRVKALNSGASDYLTKPFDQLELVKRIEVQLENKRLTKSLYERNHHLEQMVQSRTQDIREAYLEILTRLGRASEYRDNETGNHIRRVSYFSELIALDAGLGEETAHLIRVATPMHDVGKIGIPDKILLKPGKLDDDEFEIMKTHVTIGAEILSGETSEFLKMAHDIALSHHEKYNGKGYPNGLIGEAIPISGRIVAIADVFDALTSVRPYKKAWSIDDAVALIQSESGQHFDPELVQSFIRVLPEIVEIKERYADTLD